MRGPTPPDSELAFAGPPAAAGSYRTIAIEVTQTIQDPTNSVPLIAGKATVVRVFLDRPDPDIITVHGELEVTRRGFAPATVLSIGALELDPASNGDLTGKRLRLNGSLNFKLPETLTVAGACALRLSAVRVSETGETLVSQNVLSAAITFIDAAPLRVRLVAFRYQTGNPPRDHEPASRDYALIESWLRRVYPTPRVQLSRITVEGMKPWPNKALAVNVQLTAMRNADLAAGGDPLAHYFGLVADTGSFMQGLASVIPNQPDPSAVASGPTGSRFFKWSPFYGDWYTAHELGHTFGRPHVGSGCGEAPKDPAFPYPAGQLTGADGAFVGFDVGDPALGIPMAVYSGVQYHDLMSYCPFIWISSYTYRAILDRMASEAAAQLAALPVIWGFALTATMPVEETQMGKWLNVVGTVNFTEGSGSIQVMQPLSGADPPAGTEERAAVQLFDSAGMLLATVPARVKMDACRDEGEPEVGILDTFAPFEPDTARVDLTVFGQPVDSRSAPGASAIAGFALPGAEATYTIQVSADEGASWQTVAVGAQQPEYEVRRADFPDADRLRVRVLASDGFNATLVREEQI